MKPGFSSIETAPYRANVVLVCSFLSKNKFRKATSPERTGLKFGASVSDAVGVAFRCVS